jgi:hypothetical protein
VLPKHTGRGRQLRWGALDVWSIGGEYGDRVSPSRPSVEHVVCIGVATLESIFHHCPNGFGSWA